MILKNATFIDWQTLEFKHNCNIKVHEGVNGKIEFVKEIPQGETTID